MIKDLRKTVGTSAALILAVMAGAPESAQAGAIIYNTGDAGTATVALGVNDLGHLNVSTGNIATNASATGLATIIDGRWEDATSPGCLCEGYGVAANGVSGSANRASVTAGLTLSSFASTSSTATSVAYLTSLPDLTITHAYAPSAAGSLFEAKVTITNNSDSTMTDVRYTRAMDWDVPPTEFAEYVTIQGTATTSELLYSSDNGFVNTNPFAARSARSCPETTDFVDCGASDHGAVFDFGFGDLAAGESKEFSIFYGATADEASALAALATVGAELFSLGQQKGDPLLGTPATFIFGFSGVGGEPILSPVPVPATLPMLAMGLAGLGWLRRRKQKTA